MRTSSNPFSTNRPEVAGHVSCRSIEIEEIVTGSQNALILAGTPTIGKSTLIHYLTLPPSVSWSWRNELNETDEGLSHVTLDDIRFAQIDLLPLLRAGDFSNRDELLRLFITECTKALYRAYTSGESTSSQYTLSELYQLLHDISSKETSDMRYFLILDNVEPLGKAYKHFLESKDEHKTHQEFGLSLLDRCRAIRTIVDIIDDFRMIGFILSIESLPRARVAEQFTHVSADLARFKTKTLQVFTMDDTRRFLAQKRDNFRDVSADFPHHGSSSNEDTLFSQIEQEWLLRLAGTHPYLLQLCCYNLFQFKNYLKRPLDIQLEREKEQLLSVVYEQVGTFPSSTWKRLQEAIQNSSNISKVEEQFDRFVLYCANKYADDQIDYAIWDSLDPELRYILYSEGIVRYDPLQPIYFPGSILRDYLVQQTRDIRRMVTEVSAKPERVHTLTIINPEMAKKQVPLSRLEYRLLKTLIEHADYCTEQELIQSAWEKGTERANLTQRLHKLRNKLKELLNGVDIVENRYGGIYSLTHPQWLQID
ncbi:MAG: hypothetical protein NVS4B1_21820 [Ktedonobacteraceae bacterium]